ARAGQPWHRAVQHAAETRRAVEAGVFPGRESLGAEAAEFTVLVPDGARLGRNLRAAGLEVAAEETIMKRRTLLEMAAAGLATAALPVFARKIQPLNILILGGTRFI